VANDTDRIITACTTIQKVRRLKIDRSDETMELAPTLAAAWADTSSGCLPRLYAEPARASVAFSLKRRIASFAVEGRVNGALTAAPA